jgi:YHS domain-containing protein
MKKLLSTTILAASLTLAQTPAGQKPPKEAKDPVCGMTVDPKAPETAKSEYKGKTYYFCSKDDKQTFDKSPEKYVAKADSKK